VQYKTIVVCKNSLVSINDYYTSQTATTLMTIETLPGGIRHFDEMKANSAEISSAVNTRRRQSCLLIIDEQQPEFSCAAMIKFEY